MVNEDLLQFVWQHKCWDYNHCRLTNGAEFEVIDTGIPNYDSGPDFFNAKIKVGNTIWAGNVEIHTSSSQWFRHNHHLDKAYDNVILHVVCKHDKEVKSCNGMFLPVFEMKIPSYVTDTFGMLSNKTNWPACEKYLSSFENAKMKFWLNRCAVERLEQKTELLKQRFLQNNGNWEALWLSLLGSSMGFKVNKEPFEMLMQRTPLNLILKNAHDLFQLEALLFGQAGLLEGDIDDKYYISLKQEYSFIKQKFDLNGIPGFLWKFARMRPANFPTLRLAQFAASIHKHPAMVADLLETHSYNHVAEYFNAGVSEYWHSHYRFGAEVKHNNRVLGKTAVDLIIINVVIPFLFFYGKQNDLPEKCELAADWLSKTVSEDNFIVRRWIEVGINPESALESQALLHLRENYCIRHRCPHCSIGNSILLNVKINEEEVI